MSNDARLREPSAYAIQTGYYLTKARKIMEEALEPLGEAMEYALAARETLTADGTAFYMEFSPILKAIDEARAACHAAGCAHEIARQFMERKGFRAITNRDFATYGSGGGR